MGRFASVQSAHVGVDSIEDSVIILPGGQYRAVLEVSSVNFALLGEVEQEATIAGFTSFLGALSFPMQIVVRSVSIDLEGYLGDLENRALQLHEELAALARDHVLFLRRLARSRTLLERRFYLVIPARETSSHAGRSRPWFLGRKAPESAEPGRRQLSFRCEEVARELARCGLGAHRLSSLEIARLLYDCWCPELARVQRIRRELSEYTTDAVSIPKDEDHCRAPSRPRGLGANERFAERRIRCD